jgi:DDE family transposase
VEVTDETLSRKLSIVMPHLDERQRRIVAGAEARALGRGGIAMVARVTGMSRSTVQDAVAEVDAGVEPSTRVRRPGGGRKPLPETDPTLLADLEALVAPESRGDPESPLRWTAKSTRTLALELAGKGHRVSHVVVGELLRGLGYSLQSTQKTKEGSRHPDRDAQFRYLSDQAAAHLAQGQPVISVDTKKKELVGEYANKGQEWQPKGAPEKVKVHDFIDPSLGKAIPYGVYDVGLNEGWVSVGVDHDTSAFAVATIRRWWEMIGSRTYPDATRLLISADGGGSNGYRSRLWKLELGRLAEEQGLEITVCHLPPGTSKWNKIEHRLFSHISMNWRGRPLVTHEVIVGLIASTTTRRGLKVKAELDTGTYETGINVSDDELAAIPIEKHAFHGEWNYTVRPKARGPT